MADCNAAALIAANPTETKSLFIVLVSISFDRSHLLPSLKKDAVIKSADSRMQTYFIARQQGSQRFFLLFLASIRISFDGQISAIASIYANLAITLSCANWPRAAY
jgi:hypothetical protein